MNDQELMFNELQRKRMEEEELKNKRPYQLYINRLLSQLESGDDVVKKSINIPCPRNDGYYYCLKEPEEFIRYFNRYSSSQKQCNDYFNSLLENRSSLVLEQILYDGEKNSAMWFNSSAAGINLRPGLEDNQLTKPTVVKLGNPEDNVHALIVGATGSGKSVFLHNLLFSLMAEYAPWELNLFLVDFKKVSFSKYLSEYQTPHIKSVAATSEIRYVISLLTYLNTCMKARQSFFSWLGVEKLEDFRNKYQVILPRVILLIDEFQQMFTNVSSREETVIKEILTSITKLGRATGFHLIFASQEMNSTLGGNAFANFKVRFALRCNADVSSEFLGNPAASKIGSREKGYVIENSIDGKEENNRTYKVPLVEDDGGYFYGYLKDLDEMAKRVGFYSVHKYYQEDFIRPFTDLETLLNDQRVYSRRNEIICEKPYVFELMTLGDSVVFNYKKNDYETVVLEKGSNKNIGIFSPDVDDLAYICRILSLNFRTSPKASSYNHLIIYRNDYLERSLDLPEQLMLSAYSILHTDDDIDNYVLDLIRMRKEQLSLIQHFEADDDLSQFARSSFRIQGKYLAEGLSDSSLDWLSVYFENAEPEQIPYIISQIEAEYPDIDEDYFAILMMLYRVICENVAYSELFDPYICWVLGTEMIDNLPRDAERILPEASNLQVFVIFAGSSDRHISTLYNSCDYLFVCGNVRKVYDRWDIPYTQKEDDSIVIDFKIRSANECRSFKKFYLEKEIDAPIIDFDSLLS